MTPAHNDETFTYFDPERARADVVRERKRTPPNVETLYIEARHIVDDFMFRAGYGANARASGMIASRKVVDMVLAATLDNGALRPSTGPETDGPLVNDES